MDIYNFQETTEIVNQYILLIFNYMQRNTLLCVYSVCSVVYCSV
jgi:hypothetical protein